MKAKRKSPSPLGSELTKIHCEDTKIWKPVPMFDKYFVSNHGDIKTSSGFKPETFINNLGYEVAKLNEGIYTLHRLIAFTHIPNPDNKITINHIDGNKANNHVLNLEWATYSENRIHALMNGLVNTTLSPGDVLKMRELYHIGMSPSGIARKFGYNYNTIRKAVIGITWDFLPIYTKGTYTQMSIFDLPGVSYENK